jgi:hypothetical protein
MPPRRQAPVIAYPFAVLAGLFGLSFEHLLSLFAATPSRGEVGFRMVLLASFAVAQFVLGASFGLLWPRPGWRWGVWLCAVPACVISFYGHSVWFFAGWWVLTMLPACAGAYAAAELLYPRLYGAVRN